MPQSREQLFRICFALSLDEYKASRVLVYALAAEYDTEFLSDKFSAALEVLFSRMGDEDPLSLEDTGKTIDKSANAAAPWFSAGWNIAWRRWRARGSEARRI